MEIPSGIFLTLVIFITANSVSALNEESAKEMSCISVSPDPSLDWDWVFKVKKWYFPMWSKLVQYRMASIDLGKKVEDITEAELVNDCEVLLNNSVFKGFHHSGVKGVHRLDKEGGVFFHIDGHDDIPETNGKMHLIKTDNKEYVVGIQCWSDNQASWDVKSTKPTISPDIKKDIIEQMQSLGFNMDMLVEENYDHCDDTIPSVSAESFETSEEFPNY